MTIHHRIRHVTGCLLIPIGLLPGAAGAQDAPFRRGDGNADGVLDLSDPIRLLNSLFISPAPFACQDAADTNDDGALDMSDAIYALTFLFNRGFSPPPPWPACGDDPTPDRLTCAEYEGVSAVGICSTENDPGAKLEAEVLYLTNLERARLGVPPLKHHPLLAQSIRGHCRDMAAQDYFSHVSRDGRDLVDRIQAIGYRGTIYGRSRRQRGEAAGSPAVECQRGSHSATDRTRHLSAATCPLPRKVRGLTLGFPAQDSPLALPRPPEATGKGSSSRRMGARCSLRTSRSFPSRSRRRSSASWKPWRSARWAPRARGAWVSGW